ncbi:MAG: phage baseplate protein [Gammaproteobacteria bacterium]|nr:phage baseplate protein [Gammaproteobacteria bacterium]
MRALSASELLDVWERGKKQTPVQQALILLAASFPENPVDSLAKLTIGQRDAYLLTLRELIFGSRYNGLTTCPECEVNLEMGFSTDDIRITPEEDPLKEHTLNVDDYDVCFRLPDSLDLAAISSHNLSGHYDISEARQELIERCLLRICHSGEMISPEQLENKVIEAVVERMAEIDPQSDVQLALSCFSCGHKWMADFDIVRFFWSEINAWAYRILKDVHTLALAYGWTQADILAMSPLRRQVYLEMVMQ